GRARGFRQREHFVRSHKMRAGLAGILAKGAVAAIVSAESSQRNENFLGKADGISFAAGAHFAGEPQQVRRGGLHVEKKRPAAIHALAHACFRESFLEGVMTLARHTASVSKELLPLSGKDLRTRGGSSWPRNRARRDNASLE